MESRGLPAHELSDAELEHQGSQAHATRNWVFLHGSAEQFRRHTERMLELEQEYLRRHPKRTWQGAAGGDETGETLTDLDRLARMRQLFRSFTQQMEALLADPGTQTPPGEPGETEARLLARFAEAPDGRMHKLEAHQAAREIATDAVSVARLYKHDPPLLATAGSYRFITDEGRSWLDEHRSLVEERP